MPKQSRPLGCQLQVCPLPEDPLVIVRINGAPIARSAHAPELLGGDGLTQAQPQEDMLDLVGGAGLERRPLLGGEGLARLVLSPQLLDLEGNAGLERRPLLGGEGLARLLPLLS